MKKHKPKRKGYWQFSPDITNKMRWKYEHTPQLQEWAAIAGSIAINNIYEPFYFHYLNHSIQLLNYIEERKGDDKK